MSGNEKKNFLSAEKFFLESKNKCLLEGIQGFNPIYEKLKKYLFDNEINMEFYIWGDYIFNSDKIEQLILSNWKGGLKEGEHFFKITTTFDLDNFDKELNNHYTNHLETEKNRITSFLKEDLSPEEKEKMVSLVLSAENLKGEKKFFVMKKVEKYVKKRGELNSLFKVNKNFFKEYTKKEQEETR